MNTPTSLKRFHDAWIRSVATECGLPMSEVRECYPDENYSYNNWWATLVEYVRDGNTLPLRILNSHAIAGCVYNYRKLALDCHPLRPFPREYVIPTTSRR